MVLWVGLWSVLVVFPSHTRLLFVNCQKKTIQTIQYNVFYWHLLIQKGSYMSAHLLLNFLNEFRKRDKMRGSSSILSLFRNEFNVFNN